MNRITKPIYTVKRILTPDQVLSTYPRFKYTAAWIINYKLRDGRNAEEVIHPYLPLSTKYNYTYLLRYSPSLIFYIRLGMVIESQVEAKVVYE